MTESFLYDPKGFQGFMYDSVLRRAGAMTRGMRRTLDRVKATLEAR